MQDGDITTGARLINVKKRPSGMMLGFGDLLLPGLCIRNCKIFFKPSSGQAWVSPPSEKIPGQVGSPDTYRDLVEWTSSMSRAISSDLAPVIRHLAGVAPAPQQQELPGAPPAPPSAPAGGSQPSRSAGSQRSYAGSYGRGDHGEAAIRESRRASQDPLGADIPY